MRHTDTQLGHPAREVRLIRYLRHHNLGDASPCGHVRSTHTTVMDSSGHPTEQHLLVHLADRETVGPVVGQGQIGPATSEDNPAALGPDRLDCHLGGVNGCGRAAETHVHRRFPGSQKRFQLNGKRPFVGQGPSAGPHRIAFRRILSGAGLSGAKEDSGDGRASCTAFKGSGRCDARGDGSHRRHAVHVAAIDSLFAPFPALTDGLGGLDYQLTGLLASELPIIAQIY